MSFLKSKYFLILIIILLIGIVIVFFFNNATDKGVDDLEEVVEKPDSEASKSLKLLSPDDGELWEVGKEYNIQWESDNIEKINIYLTGSRLQDGLTRIMQCLLVEGAKCQSPCGDIVAEGVDASSGNYSWLIRENQEPYLDAKIHIQEHVSDIMEEECLLDSSNNYFHITND